MVLPPVGAQRSKNIKTSLAISRSCLLCQTPWRPNELLSWRQLGGERRLQRCRNWRCWLHPARRDPELGYRVAKMTWKIYGTTFGPGGHMKKVGEKCELWEWSCLTSSVFSSCQGILRHGKRRHFLFQFCSGPMQNNDVLCFILRCRCTITVSDAASDMQDSTMLTIANMCSMPGCYNVNIGWTREAGCEENCRLLANTKDHLVIFSGTFRPLDIGLIITPEILESPQSLACLVLWLCGLSQPT